MSLVFAAIMPLYFALDPYNDCISEIDGYNARMIILNMPGIRNDATKTWLFTCSRYFQ